jgi:hypothetical protein
VVFHLRDQVRENDEALLSPALLPGLFVAHAPPVQLAEANPPMAMAFPHTLTGAWTVLLTWFPVPIPALGPVESACAGAPRASAPPVARAATATARRIRRFTVVTFRLLMRAADAPRYYW